MSMLSKFYERNGRERLKGFQGFLFYHYVAPIIVFDKNTDLEKDEDKDVIITNKKMFAVFAQIVPTVLAIAGTAVLGGFFAHKLWEKAIGDLVAKEALMAINVSSIVLASITAGIIASIAVPNLVALIANTSVNDLPVMKFYKVDATGFEIFCAWHYVFPFRILVNEPPVTRTSAFAVFAQIVPTVLAIAGTAVLGGFFAEKLWEKAIGDLVAKEALMAINVSSIVLASITAGIIASIAVPNVVAAIINACKKSEGPELL